MVHEKRGMKVSIVNLVILGMVMEKPISAYEIVKEVEARNMNKWVKISPPAIYKNVIQLNKKEYIHGEIIKEGKMPEKNVYTLTKKGHDYFMKLMDDYSKDFGNTYFSFTPVLMNLSKVDPAYASELLDTLKIRIQENKNTLIQRDKYSSKIPPTGQALIKLYKELFILLDNWMDDFTTMYEQEKNKNT